MKSDSPKNGASRRAAANAIPRLARPPMKASGSNNRWRQTAAGDGRRGTAGNGDSISGRTVRLRIPGISLSSGEESGGRLVGRPEDPKLSFELLDDDDGGILELQFRDPAAQIVDLEQVFVHPSSLFKIRYGNQPRALASPRGGGWRA